MGKLSTHILNLAQGCPAPGIPIALFHAGRQEPIFTGVSNSDGRTDKALLSRDELLAGEYELVFHVADYFCNSNLTVSDPPFFDRIAFASISASRNRTSTFRYWCRRGVIRHTGEASVNGY